QSEINPRGNRFLVTFLPGHSEDLDPAQYRMPEIVDEINRDTSYGLHLFGGVSSVGLQPGVGFQFLGTKVYQHSAVAALVKSDVPYGIGISDGLVGTDQYYCVTSVSPDGRSITSFDSAEGHDPKSVIERNPGKVFGQRTPDGETIVYVPRMINGEV